MDEKKRILEMLEKGKITAEEANELLEAIGENENSVISKPKETNKVKSKSPKFRVIIKTNEGDNVNISIPLKLAKISRNVVPKSARAEMEEAGIDFDALLDNLDEFDEDIVNIETEDGDIIRVFIER